FRFPPEHLCPLPLPVGFRYIGSIQKSGGRMRSRLILFILTLYLGLTVLGCTSKPATDNSADAGSNGTAGEDATKNGKEPREHKEHKEAQQEKKKEPVVVPAGTEVTVSLGSALGSKLSQS